VTTRSGGFRPDPGLDPGEGLGLDGQGAAGPENRTKKKRPEGRSIEAVQPPHARGMDAGRP
jgi:hypothetical protein